MLHLDHPPSMPVVSHTRPLHVRHQPGVQRAPGQDSIGQEEGQPEPAPAEQPYVSCLTGGQLSKQLQNDACTDGRASEGCFVT